MGRGETGTGSLGKSNGRIAFRPRGNTPRRRGDSARRVQWPEQGETRQVSQVTTLWTSFGIAPQPPAGKPPTTTAARWHKHAKATRGLLQHLAARSRPLACLGSIRSHQHKANRIDPPAREHIVTKVHVRELKNPAPECRRSAASGMRRTIAPLPFDHQHRHSQPTLSLSKGGAEGDDQHHQGEQRDGRGLHQVAARSVRFASAPSSASFVKA